MSIDELRAQLDATADLPTEEAVPQIATALQGQTLLVPIAGYDEATGAVQLLTGKDASGVVWIYADTGEDVMVAGGLTGKQCGHFDFLNVVRMGQEGSFGGIAVDLADGTARAFIPGYWFAEIERVLGGT